MKTLKTSSAYFLRTLERFTLDFGKTSQRISSGKKLPQDSPFSLYISRDVRNKVEYLNFISQHVARTTAILQKYEEVLNSVDNYLVKLKTIAERAVFESSPSEIGKLEKAYTSNLNEYKKFIRSERLFGRNIARGGFSNEVLSTEVVSGDASFTPPDVDVSGINFRKYGVEEEGVFYVEVSRSGDVFEAKIIVGSTVVDTERVELSTDPQNMPFRVDFQEIGISLSVPASSGDFQVRFKVGAEPVLSLFGEGKEDFEKFFLPSLEPESIGLPSDFEKNPQPAVEKIEEAIKKISEIKAEIGGKIDKLRRRSDLNSIVQARSKIFSGKLGDTDMTSEAVLLSLRQTLLSVDFSVAQRSISMLSLSIDMLRR